jgi:hypothetical protein
LKKLFAVIFCLFLNSFFYELYPADIKSESDFICLPLADSTQPAQDTTQYQDEDNTSLQQERPKLLPDDLSFGERLLWGQKGFFREIGVAPLTPEARKSELEVRRGMLYAHQVGGFVSLASMIATCYYGQRIIDGHRNLTQEKGFLITSTILLYSVTGLLAILSPPPLIRREDETSTTTIHKLLAWFHVAGMIATPLIASGIREREPGTRHTIWNMGKAHFHQIAGYITTAIFTAAMITVTF